MLILTPHIGQALYVSDEVQVTVLGIKGGQVRIGIEAPETGEVDREGIRRCKQASEARPA